MFEISDFVTNFVAESDRVAVATSHAPPWNQLNLKPITLCLP